MYSNQAQRYARRQAQRYARRTVVNDTALASAVCLASVSIAYSTLGTAVNDTALASAVCNTSASLSSSPLFTPRLKACAAFQMTFGQYIWFIKHTKNLIQLPFLTPR